MIQENKAEKSKKLEKEVAEWVFSIVIAVALALLINNFVFQIIRVDGPSMEPTLYTDQRMAVTRFSYYFSTPQRGDIVVTKFPDDDRNFVKRVIGLPGETLKIRDGKVYINDVALDEPYIKAAIEFDYGEIVIPEGKYMVMGDNRNNSSDSRKITVGPLDLKLIVGKSQYVVWPLDEIHQINHYTGHLDE